MGSEPWPQRMTSSVSSSAPTKPTPSLGGPKCPPQWTSAAPARRLESSSSFSNRGASSAARAIDSPANHTEKRHDNEDDEPPSVGDTDCRRAGRPGDLPGPSGGAKSL